MFSEDMKKFRPAIVLTFGLFALWGVGHRLYETVVPEFAKVLELNSAQLILAQSVYSLVYLVFAVPAAIYSRTFGSKATIVFGLGFWAVGAFLFYPAALAHAYGSFLFAAAVMSCGYLFLEIGANPIVAGMGPPETTVRRLNFAHACYPLGVLFAVYVGRWVILSNDARPLAQLAGAIVKPYMLLGLGLLLSAFLVDKIAFPPFATERVSHRKILGEFRTLLARPKFLAAVAALGGATAARTGTWALSILYVKNSMPHASALTADDYLLLTLVTYAIGRWVGAFLMFRFDPVRLLAVFAASGVVLGAVATLCGGTIGVYAIVGSGFSVSIMFATILGTAIKDLGPLTKAGTALMYTGSSGIGIGLVIMYLIWTVTSVQFAMIVPTLGYAGVLAFALFTGVPKAAQPVAQLQNG
jgi:FHS family L-fucose permease-like MFS transporter